MDRAGTSKAKQEVFPSLQRPQGNDNPNCYVNLENGACYPGKHATN